MKTLSKIIATGVILGVTVGGMEGALAASAAQGQAGTGPKTMQLVKGPVMSKKPVMTKKGGIHKKAKQKPSKVWR